MKNEVKKESAVVFVSQLELIKTLPKNQQLDFLYALFDYEMYGIEPKPSLFSKNKILEAIWLMSKPLIDKRIKWVENGRKNGLKGGAPVGNQNAKKSKNNQETTKKQPTNNQKTSKNKLYKDKDKDMDMDKEYPYPSRISLDAYPVGTDIKDDYIDREDEELPVDENGNWIWPDE